MADEATAVEETKEESKESEEDQRVPYDRFQKANKQAKEAKEQAKQFESKVAELQAQLEERDQKGLPEVEKLKQEFEKAVKRADAAEKEATEAKTEAQNSKRERWVVSAATEQNFIDPDDAARFVDLGDIESSEDAQRAVKAVAKQKEHLIRTEERKLPGQVLKDGQRSERDKPRGGINSDEEAEHIGQQLRDFLNSPASTVLLDN